MLQMLGFAVFMTVIVVGVHYYLWHRLIKSTTGPGPWRRGLTWALVAMALVTVGALAGARLFPAGVEHVIAWPGYIWFALMVYLLLFLVLLEIPRAIANRVSKRQEATAKAAGDVVADEEAEPSPEPEAPAAASPVLTRRLFIARTSAVVAGVGAAATVGFGMRSALGPPKIERVPITLAKLDPRMNGLRVAVVSDIHLGPLTGVGHTERIVRMINELDADLVTIVGDLVDGSVAELGDLARPLSELEKPSYFVTGNHEYYTSEGPQEWIDELRELGVTPLVNERVEITRGGAVLDLAGVNDLGGEASGQGPDLERALDGRDQARPVVLLAHQPLQVKEAAGFGVDLQLSGHTHGGQMAPFNMVVGLQQPVTAGLETVDGTQVYVTRGAGYWGPPVRVGAPPEITLLTLNAG
ncbi:metallophosphoesterase [Phytomonospora sp. NPDC050363]|uniref:metallophosphoesterase n=1 Tax=Phytomonospora sp. NPDC050363 TaxID=3155642 RepID=UPI0033F57A28